VDISKETIEAMYTALQPDQKLCVHEVRGKAFRIPDETNLVGVMVRIVGHGTDEKPVSIDLMFDSETAVKLFGMVTDTVPTMAAYDITGNSLEALALAMIGGDHEHSN